MFAIISLPEQEAGKTSISKMNKIIVDLNIRTIYTIAAIFHSEKVNHMNNFKLLYYWRFLVLGLFCSAYQQFGYTFLRIDHLIPDFYGQLH